MHAFFHNPAARATCILLALAASITGCTTLAAADPNALWQIAHFDCVPAARTSSRTGVCASVDLAHHYVVLKDRGGIAQHLLIPTDRISGVESPALLAPDAENYWADAWHARSFVQSTLKAAGRNTLSDDQLGLEINSAYRRSQEQLHIHIDCMRATAIDALAHHRHDVPNRWTSDTIDGKRYQIMRVRGPSFEVNPFDIVARESHAPDSMAMQTILVTGAGPSATDDGWLIVNSAVDAEGGTGSAEVLLDHQCEVAAKH
ncbi:CDP-diacylglycerol diphosphatase [Trinickia sp. LjRoot230]|uniref:CDP-diacylglycerol diphosphatase n=1 Tax=Trinickia sp. LjRoot230 TaxID=3342288 RepID=UPI003ECDEE4F